MNSFWKINKTKPISRTYELAPEGRPHAALEGVIADLTAAHRLGIPVKVETVHSTGFRHGGNVNKADIYSYRVTWGELEDESKS